MTNPDNNTNVSSTMPSSLFNMLTLVLIILLFILISMFTHTNNNLNKLFIWLIFPLLSYAITFGINVWNQYVNCNETDLKMAALGSIPMTGAIYVSLLVSLIPFFRIPIVSVIAPLFYGGNTIDVVNSSNSKKNAINSLNTNLKSRIRECCPSQMTLEQLENNINNGYIIKSSAIIFYLIFGVLFGNVFSFGISSIC